MICCLKVKFMLYIILSCSQFYLQRSNYTVPFSKLKKTDPKAQQFGVWQSTLRSNRTATRHRPVKRTANAADAPSFVQNVWPDHEVCLGSDGLRNKWNQIVWQCLAWFSLGCSSTIWTESSLELWRMGSGAFSGKMSAESLWIWFSPAPWSGRDLATTALARWHTWSDIYTSWRMTYDFSGTISKTSCHMAIIEWLRPQKVVERWPSEGQLRKKNASVSEDCGKNQYWTWLTAPRHPNCYWICCKHLQTLLRSQKGRKKHIILSSGSLNCLARCRCWSFPRSSKIPLRSGNGPNWPIECDELCTSWHS